MGFVIGIYAPDGKPEGLRLVKKDNWPDELKKAGRISCGSRITFMACSKCKNNE